MKTWMFYSYKGGAGRTVAAANIAAALAKLGKRVMLIDLDVEAPGLHHLFDMRPVPGDPPVAWAGIQDYLKGDVELENVSQRLVIELTSPQVMLTPEVLPEDSKGKLFFIRANDRTTELFASIPDIHDRMKQLIEHVGKEKKLDYVILDSASGIREAFTLSVQPSDAIVVLFRWSEQHFEGTLRFCKLLRDMEKLPGSIFRPFHLVASAVPRERDLDGLAEGLREHLKRSKNNKLARLAKDLGSEYGTLFDDIPEIVELKWKETVIALDRQDTPYERIARKLMGAHQPARPRG